MNLDVRVSSIDTDGDAPPVIWLKERGFATMTPESLANHLGLSRSVFIVDDKGFPDLKDYVIPKHFVVAVPCNDGRLPHYWTYRFHPDHRDTAMLFKLTLSDVK